MALSHIVIPARLASTRLPEKLLLRRTGKSVLQHTYEAASKAKRPSGITVAVDHQRLFDEVTSFGGVAIMTDPQAASGTDRVAEVALSMSPVEIFVNVQGDEPEIEGEAIDLVVDLLEQHPEADVATLATPIRSQADALDPSCVKVVCDRNGRALYFSRSIIPFDRDQKTPWNESDASDESAHALRQSYLQHLGIYAYRRRFLLELKNLPSSPLEQLEKLEQLRFLQAGYSILVGSVSTKTRGIDTLPDYEAFVSRQSG